MEIKGLDYHFNFGKHNGQTIEEVLELDPSYLIWVNNNITWFKINPVIIEEAESMVIDHEFSSRIRKHISKWNDFNAFDDDYYSILDPSDYF